MRKHAIGDALVIIQHLANRRTPFRWQDMADWLEDRRDYQSEEARRRDAYRWLLVLEGEGYVEKTGINRYETSPWCPQPPGGCRLPAGRRRCENDQLQENMA